jgi:lysophospholipase L1-like esterase
MSTICIFGDSITWGEGDPVGGGWAAHLKRNFEEEKYGISVYNLGIDGDTSTGLVERFTNEAKVRQPDIIIFAIGINDSIYRGSENKTPITPESFETNLAQLVSEAKKITRTLVFIGLTNVDEPKVQPFPWSTTGKCYSNRNILKYNNIIKSVCSNNNLHFIEMADLLQISDLSDGLHPNSEGHKKMFKEVKDYLLIKKVVIPTTSK